MKDEIYSDDERFNCKYLIRCAASKCGDTISYFFHPDLHTQTIIEHHNWTRLGTNIFCTKCTVRVRKQDKLFKERMEEIDLKYPGTYVDETDYSEPDWKEHWGWWTREDDRASSLF